jgi:hypothetical protein
MNLTLVINNYIDHDFKDVKVIAENGTEITSELIRSKRSKDEMYLRAANATVKEITKAYEFIEKVKNHALAIPEYKFFTMSGENIYPTDPVLTITSTTLPVKCLQLDDVDTFYITYKIEEISLTTNNNECIFGTFYATIHDNIIKTEVFQIDRQYYTDDRICDWFCVFITKLINKLDDSYKIMRALTNEQHNQTIQFYNDGKLMDHKKIIEFSSNLNSSIWNEGESELKFRDGAFSDDEYTDSWRYRSRYNDYDDNESDFDDF